MNSKRNRLSGLICAVAAAFLWLAPGAVSAQQQIVSPPAATSQQQQFDGPKLYKEVFELVRDHHINYTDPTAMQAWAAVWEHKYDGTGALDTEKGTDEAIAEMLRSTRQIHDHYLVPAAVEHFNQQIDPSITGIGIYVQVKGTLGELKKLNDLGRKPTEAEMKAVYTVTVDRPFVVVEDPFENSPAEKAGLKSGDTILTVDGKPIVGKTSDEVVELIRGKAGTTVTLGIERADGKGGVTPLTVPVVRARVTAKVTRYKDLGDGVAYVRLADFMSRNVESEMRAALTRAAGGKALVLDLRGNGGGRLEAAFKLAEYLMPEGTVLVKQERHQDHLHIERTVLQPDYVLLDRSVSNDPSQRQVGMEDRDPVIIPADMPIVVLIDGGSASASEILSGALAANHRATLVGKPTYGKGVGQTVVPVSYGRKVDVTTFEFLPGGNHMDLTGVLPDIDVEQPVDDFYDPNKDTQLEAAKKAALDAVARLDARKATADKLHQDKIEAWEKMTAPKKDDSGN